MNDLDGFYCALEYPGGDLYEKMPESYWFNLLVLADWFEENGFADNALAARWLTKNKRRPYTPPPNLLHPSGAACTDRCYHWNWFNEDTTRSGTDPSSNLPGKIFAGLTGRAVVKGVFVQYQTIRLALDDFYRSFALARKEGFDAD